MDVRCRMEDGSYCNVEIQKDDIHDDIRRTRYNAAFLLLYSTPMGTDFKDIPDVIVIYITRYDALKNGQVCTEVRRCQKINGEYVPIDDGEAIYFANADAGDDGSPCYRYLNLMQESGRLDEAEFPKTCERVNYYMFTEEGGNYMRLQEACEKFNSLAGIRFGELFSSSDMDMIIVNKGKTGQLLELALGMHLSSTNLDFEDGELKTNKCDSMGNPKETVLSHRLVA